MDRKILALKFIDALERQVNRKTQMKDGIYHKINPLEILASITEEAGEVASDFVRGRNHGVIEECIDVAHSALLLAIILDEDGTVLDRIHAGEQ